MRTGSLSRRCVLTAIGTIPLVLSGCVEAQPKAAPTQSTLGISGPVELQAAVFNEATIIHLMEDMAADKEDGTAIRKIMQGILHQKGKVSILSISMKTAEAIRAIDRAYPNDVFMSEWHDVPTQENATLPHGITAQVKNGIVSVNVAQVSFRDFKGVSLPATSVTNGTMPFKGAVLVAINDPQEDETPGFIRLGDRTQNDAAHEWILIVPKDARAG